MQISPFSPLSIPKRISNPVHSAAIPSATDTVHFSAKRPEPFKSSDSPLQELFESALASNKGESESLNKATTLLLRDVSSGFNYPDLTVHPGTAAIGFIPGSQTRILRSLRNLGLEVPLQLGESINYLTVELPDSSDKAKGATLQNHWEALQEWADQSADVRYISPLMKEKNGYRKVLTDEMTIRFETVPTKAELKRIEDRLGLVPVKQDNYVKQQFMMKNPRSTWTHILTTAKQLGGKNKDILGNLKITFLSPTFISEYRRG